MKFFGLFLVFLSFHLGALEFHPMSQTFTPSGKEATKTFFAKNDKTRPIAATASISKRQVDIDGNETTYAIADEFLVYPAQLVLMPGEEKSLKVTWTGDPKPDKELSYRLVVEELPVQMTDPGEYDTDGGVQILMRYVGALYVTPEGATPKVVIERHHVDMEEEGSAKLLLTASNVGSAFGVLEKMRLKLTPLDIDGLPLEDQSITLTENELPGLKGTKILAGLQRRFELSWPQNLPKGPVVVEWEADYK